jgi:uncharacterized membrane protein
MTLLVLSLKVPDVTQTHPEDLWAVLSDDWPMFEDYALSFFLLANFWLIHHRQFRFIIRINETFLWLNILVLMLVALVPFSTEVMSRYGGTQTSALIFEGNLLAIGLVYFSMWYYATDGYRLVDREELSLVHMAYSRAYNLVLPGVSLLAMALSFLTPDSSEFVYLLVPLIILLMHRFEPNQAGK